MSNYSNAVLSLTPVAYYRLNQASGTVAADASGNGHAGALAGTITYSVPGALPSDADTALGFTASGGLNLPGIDMTAWTGYTLVFWSLVSSRWQMLAYTCDNNGGERLYLNGSPYLGGAGDVFVVAADLSAAGFVGGGDLDEVALYQSVLSPAQVAMLWSTAGYSAPTPKFFITARDNTTLLTLAAGIERDYESFTCIKRWNDVGSWVLQLRRESRYASLFKPDASGNLHTGLIFSVDYGDGNGLQQIMSGPQTAVDVSLDENNQGLVVASGACDNYWLSKRISLPNSLETYPLFMAVFGSNLLRYYQFGDASGTTAVDSSASAQNGTYNGTVTLGQAALIDDPATSVLLDGSTGYISVPTAGLPSGNAAWSLAGWGELSSYPAAGAIIFALGTAGVSKENFLFEITSGGFPQMRGSGLTTATGTTQVSLNTPHMFVATYDGTTIKGFLDGTQFGSITTGGLSITYGAATFGMYVDGTSEPWPGQLGHCACFMNALTTSLVNADGIPLSTPAWMYWMGRSIQAFEDYDFKSGASVGAALYVLVAHNGLSGLAFPGREITNLSLAGILAGATSGDDYSRFDNLLLLLQTISLKSTPIMSFRLEQSNGSLVFTEAFARDQSATAVFSLDRRNIRSYKLHYEAAKANYVYAGGQQRVGGILNSRLIAENSDATSIGQFGRLEMFLDDRSAPDEATLRGAITAALAQNAAIRSFAVTTQDTATLYFKGPGDAGYDVGDLVTVILEGQAYQDVVREVAIDLQPGAPPSITPTIGTPNGPQVANPNSHVFHEIESNANATTSIAINY